MATIQKFAPLKGSRIRWTLYLPNGQRKEKFKASSSKTRLQEILPDIMKIETLSRRCELSGQDLLRALHLGIVSQEEVGLFAEGIGGNPIPRYLDDLRGEFETQSKTQSASPHCHRVNLSRADTLEKHFKCPIQAITPEVIEQFRMERKQTVGNTTVNHDLKILRKYLDIAVSKGIIRDNPARRVSLLGEPRNRISRCLYPDELKSFFNALKQYNHLLRGEIGFIVKFLMLTGLRRSEFCNLKPDNVKLGIRQIHLVGKGRKERIVGIHRALMGDLRQRIAKGYILPPSITGEYITHAFKKVCRAAALPENITLHSLRHTYITYLLERGVDPATVRERAGHFSLSITDRYAHSLPSKRIVEDVIDIQIDDTKII